MPSGQPPEDDPDGTRRLRAFAGTLPHAVWALRFEPPLPLALPLDDAVAHFVAHAVVADANDVFARSCGFSGAGEMLGRRLAEVTPFTPAQHHLVRRFLSEGYRLDQDVLPLHGGGYVVTQQGYVHDGHLVLVWGMSTSSVRTAQLWEAEVEQLCSELATLGREVHDGLGQVLTGIRLLAESLAGQGGTGQSGTGQSGTGQALAARIADLAARAQGEARALGRSLSTVAPLSFEFRTALQGLCDEATAAGVPCRLQVEDGAPALPQLAHLHLFRIAQEAVTNALRHAHARHLEVRFGPVAHGVALVVEDDGVGPGSPAANGRVGMGLVNMQARAAAIDGTLTVEARPGGGTRVCCTLAVEGVV